MTTAAESPSWMDAKRVESVERVVLQRAKIARITRQLQNRLALASFKTKRGWEMLGLDSIEPRVAQESAIRSAHSNQLLAPADSIQHSSSTSSSSSSSSMSSLASSISTAFSGPTSISVLPPSSFIPSSFSSPIKGPPTLLPPPPTSHPTSFRRQKSKKLAHRSSPSAAVRKRSRTLSHDKNVFYPPSTTGTPTQFTPWRSNLSAANRGSRGDDEAESIFDSSPRSLYANIAASSAPISSSSAALRLSQSSPVYPGLGPGAATSPSAAVANGSLIRNSQFDAFRHAALLNGPILQPPAMSLPSAQVTQAMNNGPAVKSGRRSPAKRHSRNASWSAKTPKQHIRNKSSLTSSGSLSSIPTPSPQVTYTQAPQILEQKPVQISLPHPLQRHQQLEPGSNVQFPQLDSGHHLPLPLPTLQMHPQQGHPQAPTHLQPHQQLQAQVQVQVPPATQPVAECSPKTPPRKLQTSFNSQTGEEGADLLMFLATSPSPAQRTSFASNPVYPSTIPPSSTQVTSQQRLSAPISQSQPAGLSTPPSQQRGIPFGTPTLLPPPPQTPSQGFNFSDYVNIFTPSPAQTSSWPSASAAAPISGLGSTPAITPTRRRLNFDHFPPDVSSSLSSSAASAGSTRASSSNTGVRSISSPTSSFNGVMEVGGSLIP
ncbi:uncharacterized protein V1516DRAFT_684290 [Lipomyces oligophaga]|uniref:uncharacterized protein n=1 Tax=Lipomyces oligophaga TaxID=45792 RepID=UPI0034CDC40D